MQQALFFPTVSLLALFAPSRASTGSNQIVDPQVLYMKLTAWSRRTSMTGLKHSHPKTFG